MNDAEAIKIYNESVDKYIKVCKIQLLFKQNLSQVHNVLYLLAQIKNTANQSQNDLQTIIYQQLIISFVKLTCDSELTYAKGDTKLPISVIAQSKNINTLIVNVRNQISHGQIVDISIYVQCAQLIEQWMLEHYNQQKIIETNTSLEELSIQNVNWILQQFDYGLNKALNNGDIIPFSLLCQNLMENKHKLLSNTELGSYLLDGISFSLRSQINQLNVQRLKKLAIILKNVSNMQTTITDQMSFGDYLVVLIRFLMENKVNPGNVLLFLAGFNNFQQLNSRFIHFQKYNKTELLIDKFHHIDCSYNHFFGLQQEWQIKDKQIIDKPQIQDENVQESFDSDIYHDQKLVGITQIKEYMQENGLLRSI